MLMTEMQLGQTARITRCTWPNVPETHYQDVLVMRMSIGWVVLGNLDTNGGRVLGRGDIFVRNSGAVYEVELVDVEITVKDPKACPLGGWAQKHPENCRIEHPDKQCGCAFGQCLNGHIF
jgi:hypothetical protein